MAIARDASAQSNVALASTSVTWAHTCASGSVLAVFAKVYAVNDVSATYNGVSLGAQVVSLLMTFGEGYIVGWFIAAPDSGTHNVVVSRSGGANHLCGESVSYIGVSASGQPAQSGSVNDNGTLTFTVATDQSFLVGSNAMAFTGGNFTPISPTVEVLSGPPDLQYLQELFENGPVGTGSQTISFSVSAHTNAFAAMVLEPAGGGGGGGNPWYANAQQRVQTVIDRAWTKRGPLWTPEYSMRGVI